jgi:hypothetical protein
MRAAAAARAIEDTLTAREDVKRTLDDELNRAILLPAAFRKLPLFELYGHREDADRLWVEADAADRLAQAIEREQKWKTTALQQAADGAYGELSRLHRQHSRQSSRLRRHLARPDLMVPPRASDPESFGKLATELRECSNILMEAPVSEPLKARRGRRSDPAGIALVMVARVFKVSHREVADRIVNTFGMTVEARPVEAEAAPQSWTAPAKRLREAAITKWEQRQIGKWIKILDDAARTVDGHRRTSPG